MGGSFSTGSREQGMDLSLGSSLSIHSLSPCGLPPQKETGDQGSGQAPALTAVRPWQIPFYSSKLAFLFCACLPRSS